MCVFLVLPVAMFPTDFYVCGVSPYGGHLVVLTYDEEGAVHQVSNDQEIPNWQFCISVTSI